jgi:hypothetical protein
MCAAATGAAAAEDSAGASCAAAISASVALTGLTALTTLTTPVIFLPETPCIVMVGPPVFSGSGVAASGAGGCLAAGSSVLGWLAFLTGWTIPSPRTKPALKPASESSLFTIIIFTLSANLGFIIDRYFF